MKVQFFPKPVSSRRGRCCVCVSTVGALTLKPSAYLSRPWETTEITVFNHLDGSGSLQLHRRGTGVVKFTSSTWLTDRTRFSYDGYRRQRLTEPYVRGGRVTWPVALAAWWTHLAGRRRFEFEVDASTGSFFFWLYRVYTAVGDRRGRPVGVALDGGSAPAGVYHGAFGLAGAARADLVLPGWLPHEEEGHLRGPVGATSTWLTAAAGFQLGGSPRRGYSPGVFAGGSDGVARRVGRAVLQVSPLQRVLAGW